MISPRRHLGLLVRPHLEGRRTVVRDDPFYAVLAGTGHGTSTDLAALDREAERQFRLLAPVLFVPYANVVSWKLRSLQDEQVWRCWLRLLGIGKEEGPSNTSMRLVFARELDRAAAALH